VDFERFGFSYGGLESSSTSSIQVIYLLNLQIYHIEREIISALATHEWAQHQTRKVDGFSKHINRHTDLTWGAAATAGTISMPHIDDVGLAVGVSVLAGSKWWVFMRQRQATEEDDHRGNLFSTHAFPLNWQHTSTGKEFFQAEALHLKAGDTLYVSLIQMTFLSHNVS
jgi:hypothetical protein